MKYSQKTALAGVLVVLIALIIGIHLSWGQSQSELEAVTYEPITGLELITPEAAPESGTFWSLQKSDTEMGEPPLPFNPFPKLPLYSLSTDEFLYDDRAVNYSTFWEDVAIHWALKAEETKYGLESPVVPELGIYGESKGGGMMLLSELPSFPGEGEGDTNYVSIEYNSVVYGSNDFWLEITTVSNDLAHLILHGTVADETYEIISKEDLTNAAWASEGMVIGALDQDWTPTTVEVGTRTNTLFFRARSWVDSDGDGLPDWYEIEVTGTDPNDPDTGNTGITDGYKDGDNDGWNHLQEYQNGTNPGLFNTPAAPQGFTVTLDSSGTHAKLDWYPARGTVTGYTIQRSLTNATTQVSAATTSYTDTQYPLPTGLFFNAPAFRVQANYSSSNSAWSPWRSPEQYVAPDATIISGEDAQIVLRVASVPASAAAIRFGRYDYISKQSVTNVDFLVASITNGFAVIPVPYSVLTNWSFWLGDSYVNWISTNGVSSAAWRGNFFGGHFPPFWDGRVQMKENLIFLLRAAFPDAPFDYYDVMHWGGEDWPTNYAYADFWDTYTPTDTERMEFEPFIRNHDFKNFALNYTNVSPYGEFLTGAIWEGIAILEYPRVYEFEEPASVSTIPSLLDTNSTRWLFGDWGVFGGAEPIGVTYIPWDGEEGDTLVMSSGSRNFFGLSYVSAVYPHPEDYTEDVTFEILYPGGPEIAPLYGGHLYPETAQPEFETLGYYFARIGKDPLPDMDAFSVTNQTATLITAVGQSMQLAGYAKLAIANGYTDKFAYLGQYFDKAYKTTNGVATTNQTGILSPYGEFFATEPGRTALVTMPDLDTGERGTAAVYVVSMNLDVNHDGVMDRTLFGPDQTSANLPFHFWINDDNDGVGIGSEVDASLGPDYSYGQVRGFRNLEDFARLWISGVPPLASSNGYNVTLNWRNTSGNPGINLYPAYEGDGGNQYLQDTNVALHQLQFTNLYNVLSGPGVSLGTIFPSTSFTFPADYFLAFGRKHFLFEGAGVGSGELVLTISQGTNLLAETSAWFDLHNVREFYERVVITNTFSGPIDAPITNWSSGIHRVDYPGVSDPNESEDIILYVHGASNKEGSWRVRSETIAKRLYWAGYNGRFASVHWPSEPEISLDWFNFGELQAYKAASSFNTYLTQLRSRFPDYRLHVFAHSHGGAMTSEAFSQGGAFDTFILSQVAMAASCYDVNAPTNAVLMAIELGGNITPDWNPMGYHGAHTNITGRVVNYFNVDDGLIKLWVTDQKSFKPSPNYSYDGTNCWYTDVVGLKTLISDSQVSRARIARSRSEGIGAQGPALGQTGQGVIGSAIDLKTQFSIGDSTDEHSAFFTRPIQTIRPYFQQVLRSCQIEPAP